MAYISNTLNLLVIMIEFIVFFTLATYDKYIILKMSGVMYEY